jgi:hypothetical protein
VERTDESRSDYTIYDVYGPNGEHYEEYVCNTRIAVYPEPLELEEEIVRKPKINPPRRVRSKKPRQAVILTPPGGWFFFKG